MKYLAFFLVLVILNVLPYQGHSTVVYLQSSKAKILKMSKGKKASMVKRCSSGINKEIVRARTKLSVYNGGSGSRFLYAGR